MSASTAPRGPRAPWLMALGAIVATVLILTQVLAIVHEGEVAVPTTFGRIAGRPWTQPGLYLRWPWPVQDVHRFDARTLLLEGGTEQTLTRDGRPILVSLFAAWRIGDPAKFLERVGAIESAQRALNGLLGHWRNTVFGRRGFDELINPDPAAVHLSQIEDDLFRPAAQEARERYGIEIETVGIRALGLPPAIMDKVFERMRAERKAVADGYRAEGDAEATRIRAEADSQREKKLAEADAAAQRLRAEGDAKAAEAYAAFNDDPDLAMFLRKLDVFQQLMGRRSTVILGTDTPPFDLLAPSPATGAPPSRPASEPERK